MSNLSKGNSFELDLSKVADEWAFPLEYIDSNTSIGISLHLANGIGVPHDEVLAIIDDICSTTEDARRHFAKNRSDGVPFYVLTTAGALYVIMSPRLLEKAWPLREKIIEEFNNMEDQIKNHKAADRKEPRSNDLAWAIISSRGDGRGLTYAGEMGLIRDVISESNGKDSLLPISGTHQIEMVEYLQKIDTALLALDMPFEERKNKLVKVYQKRILKYQKENKAISD